MTNSLAAAPLPDEALVPEWTLADRLDKSLKVRGIGVGAMAEALDVSRDTVSRWINGRGLPPKSALVFWAILTGVDHGWLTTGEPSGVVDGGRLNGLPRLDSNQQPFGVPNAQVRRHERHLRLVGVKPGLTPNRRPLMALGERMVMGS